MLLVTAIWYSSIVFITNQFGSPDSLSAAGEMFGGISSLFSGLALAGVIFAVWLQTLDVKTNQTNLEKTMKTNKLSLEIMALSALTQECDSALQRYERWEKSSPNSDYKDAKATVREKLKEHRIEIENKLMEIKST